MNTKRSIEVLHCYILFIVISSILAQPNIVLILMDDVGWNDVGFHGSSQIPTPNIDALAYNGIILNRFYTQQTCTPSRTALLTGQYPMRLGMQGIPIIAGENRFVPLDVPMLPEKLKELGYSTYLVGKWHLGAAYRNVTPTHRGFDYHFGYWHGYISYFDHYALGGDMTGLDMHENLESQWSVQGRYVTDLLTEKAEQVIRGHDKSKPFFMMLSHLAGHTGKDGHALEVPNEAEVLERFKYIPERRRRLYAGIMESLDKSVGTFVSALSRNGQLDNTILIFMSDNGAQSVGVHENSGSNWPLRGMKFSLQEGAVRNIALVYSPLLKNKGLINEELMHITDLFPTLYSAAGGDVNNLPKMDGINQWPALVSNEASKRTQILVNVDEINNSSALIAEGGRYKLVNGTSAYDESYGGFFGDDGRCDMTPPYDTAAVLQSKVNTVIQEGLTEEKIRELRSKVDLNCRPQHISNDGLDDCSTFCLFDLWEDPCETKNIAKENPAMTSKLQNMLAQYWLEVKPQNLEIIDPRANPVHFNNTWYTWLEGDYSGTTSSTVGVEILGFLYSFLLLAFLV